ncbi:MAG: ribonuclease R [Aquificaceae bacterium]|nr:ribonuclease R [Aquificaceae bacterium]MDW8422850.1 ribonuclease R [Aquificaceae bacterium]
MEGVSVEDQVLNLIRSAKKPVSFEEISNRLGLDKKGRKVLKKVLKVLRKAGKIGVEKGKYVIAQEEIVTGKVIPYPAGFGFLEIGEGKKDVYIPPFEMARLFGGDVVRAKIVEYKGKKEIRVLRVLKRGKKEIVCKIQKKKKTCLGLPTDENQHQTIILDGDKCESLKDGVLVVVEIKRFPTKDHPAFGKIKEVLGHPEEKNLIIDILIRKYNLPVSYPDDVLKEAKGIKLDPEEPKRRKDLRGQLCFTIDPEKARDFDDAVAIEKTSEGYRLWVHIADVSYFVKENSPIDKEAFKRGFTFYLPDRALHMLPERLSADLCSLKPNEDRLAFTCEMLFDEGGRLLNYDIYESVIRSKARLTYGEALRLIVGDPALEAKYGELVSSLRIMEDLYRVLAKVRWEKGSIDFDLPEAELVVDEYGEPVAVMQYERHVAHRIIEQFMVSANETVAMHLENAGYPCLYRVHEKPDPTKVENLLEILAGLGYRVKKPSLSPKFFQKIIEDFEGRPEENLVRFLTLRAMKRAHYSPHNVGHFGLASEHYTHFTSPIRRYPDLIVHRLLKKAIRGEDIDYEKTLAYLEMAGMHLSQQERLAEEVEREAIDRLKARFMKSHVGEEFDGIITGVVSFGFFVEIQEYLSEGIVNISTLKEDQYVYDEPAHRLVGVSTGKVFRLGDRVRVKVVAVDEERGRLELMLV